MTSLTTAYISHGGGPLPLLGDTQHDEMISVLKTLTADIDRPDLIIVISAHWETPFISIQANDAPPLLYDYYGFPEEAYNIPYAAKGNPSVAAHLNAVINENGIAAQLESVRGYDHGMFVPLSIMYPDADIPCIQVSLKNTLDPHFHLNLGKVLRSAIASSGIEHILLLGSGSSFHNMTAFFKHEDEWFKHASEFDTWLRCTLSSNVLTEVERERELVLWHQAPQARFAHPREEHLLPLHVCYGANLTVPNISYSLTLLGKPASMFVWKER